METRSHSRLKQLAASFLYREGYLAVATEVRCPGSRYRVDVAGYLDRTPWPREEDERGRATLWSTVPRKNRPARDRRCEPRTVIIECKQSRSDFIRDDRRVDELVALREEAERWRRHLEENRIKAHEPELRLSGTALFADLEEWDFNSSRLSSYRRILRRIRRIEQQLYGETKFNLIARYRLADQLFIATPRGLLKKKEVPPGWGLIEFPGALLRAEPDDQPHDDREPPMNIVIEPPRNTPRAEQRHRLLRNIAIAATRTTFRNDQPDAKQGSPRSR